MVFENIETLKQQYTDKFVVVDESRPELRRFTGQTGTVRTVNMSGRALVEFDGNNNIGWYDIELDYLKVVDAPLPKPEMEKAAPAKAKAPAGADKASPKAAPKAAAKMSMEEMLAAARGGKSAAPAATAKEQTKPAAGGAGKMSVAEMLAAARGEKSGGAKATAAPAAQPKSAATAKPATTKPATAKPATAKPATTKPATAKPPAAKDARNLSVAEMLAAARGEKTDGGAAKAAPASAPVPETATPAAVEPPPIPAVDPEPAVGSASAGEDRGKSKKGIITDVPGMLAYCRKLDANG